MANLKSFIQKCRGALPALSILGLNTNRTTTAPSQRWTPSRDQQPSYLECRQIGRGAFATVFKVMSSRDGLFYALKKFFPPPEKMRESKRKRKRDSEAWFEDKRKEANIMRQNAHPSVVPVIDVIEESDAFSIVMPYYEHGSLEQFCPSDKDYAYTSVFLQILLAFRWLHSRGVVHRDVKPENFLLKDAGHLEIVVADFGLSKVSVDLLLTTFCGTLKYCAPEVFPGNSHGYGSKADMWSLGVMILELMFGLPKPPHLPPNPSNADLQKWVHKWSTDLRKKLVKWTEKNGLMMDILLNMIKVDPKERFTADQCLQRGLKNGLFTRDRDGEIVLQDYTGVKTPTEVSWQAESSEVMTTPQSPQLAQTTATDDPSRASILGTEFWMGSFWERCAGSGNAESANTFSSTGGSNSGRPRQRWKFDNTSASFNCTSGFNIDGGRSTGTATILGYPYAPSRGPEEEQPNIRQGSPAPPETGEAVAGTDVFGSVENRVLKLLASG